MQKAKNTKKIVLCGGHAATTALATVEELVRRKARAPWDIYWIGSARAVEGESFPTFESKIFPKVGVKTYSIVAGRIQRRLTIWTIPSLFKIPIGFFQSFILILKIRPDIILSFGGYAGFPVVVSGWLLKIPVVIHEQTIVGGLANRASSHFARKIALARSQSKEFFPKNKCVVVGNPILSGIRDILPKEKIGEVPTISIMCGSRGAQRINDVIDSILDKLLARWRVIHITGILDFEKFLERKSLLSPSVQKNYEVYSLVDPMKIDNVYREADVVIARAGANTVSEIIVTKRPAILIPIPWTRFDEQTKNAKFAEKFGIAKVLTEDALSGERLFREIEETIASWQEIVSKVSQKESPDRDAANQLVNLVEEIKKKE